MKAVITLVHLAAGTGLDLIVLDAERRTYAALNRDGDAYHLIQPARIDDPRVGDGKRREGELVCTCKSGAIRGTCYRVAEAEAYEARAETGAIFGSDPSLEGAAPGELAELFGR